MPQAALWDRNDCESGNEMREEQMQAEQMKGRRGILLDVDGTLWDSTSEVTDSWNDYGKGQPDVTHVITEDEMRGVFGRTMVEIADLIYGYLPKGRRIEVMEAAMKHEVAYLWDHPGKVYPKVRETLEKLHDDGWELMIVSNCQKGYIEDLLHELGEESAALIRDHLCYEDTGQGKDQNIRLCAERNGLDYALYVGDTSMDMEASRKAGVDFIYCAYGFGNVDAAAEGVPSAGTFSELPMILKQMAAAKGFHVYSR